MNKSLVAIATAMSLAFTTAALAYAQTHNGSHNNHQTEQQAKKSTPKKASTTKKQTTAKKTTAKKTTVVKKQSNNRFSKGQKFQRGKASNYQVVSYKSYPRKLTRPPEGYRWVRSGDDAYLIRTATNVISKVVIDVFG